MMKKLGSLFVAIMVVVTFGYSPAIAYGETINTNKATLVSISSFKKLYSAIQTEFGPVKDLSNTLLVMDDDDTLTMIKCQNWTVPSKCQYLGGPAWYSWQSSLIAKHKPSRFRVAKTSAGLLEISTLLFAMNEMGFTETEVPSALLNLTDKGINLLVETARGVGDLSATARQYSNLPAPIGSQHPTKGFLDYINDHALTLKGTASIAGPVYPDKTPQFCYALKTPKGGSSRAIAYQQGIMYLAGQNKGIALNCFLARFDPNNKRG